MLWIQGQRTVWPWFCFAGGILTMEGRNIFFTPLSISSFIWPVATFTGKQVSVMTLSMPSFMIDLFVGEERTTLIPSSLKNALKKGYNSYIMSILGNPTVSAPSPGGFPLYEEKRNFSLSLKRSGRGFVFDSPLFTSYFSHLPP